LKQPIGQPELLKEINRSRAFEILMSARKISRSTLAQATGLSRATIAVLINELLKIGLVHEIGLGDSTGGRPPIMLEFNPDAAFALGARLDDTGWGIVVTNLDAQVFHRLEVPVSASTPERVVNALKEGVKTIITQLDRRRLLPAIGLGTPGLVDVHSGVIKSAVDIGWFDVPFKEMVEEAIQLPTFVINRSKAAALAQYWYGAGQGIKDLIYIAIGTGVAAGIIHQGELYIGANSSAGELGHVTILPDGPLCPCGNRGCLQQLVSGPAIANRARELLREGSASTLRNMTGNHPELITVQAVFQAAEQDDALARKIVAEMAKYLGIAVANLINLFNPELVVLGGPVGRMSQILIEPLREEVRRRAMAYPLSVAKIMTSPLGADAGAIGASVLVLQRANNLFFLDKTAPGK
jgi:glucokinase-like ROK family protein